MKKSVRYHYSPMTGKYEKCNAIKKPCKYGEKIHFSSEEEAQNFSDDWNNLRERFNIETHDIENHVENLASSLEDNPSSDLKRTELAECKAILQSKYFKNSMKDVLKNIQTPDGGGTYNPYSNLSPQVGFCYSPYPKYSKIISKDVSALDGINQVMDYVKENQDMLRKENHYLGFWNDPQTGNVYLDISVTTMDAKYAREQCEQNDQIAFFDLQTFNSVTVDRNAKSGQEQK